MMPKALRSVVLTLAVAAFTACVGITSPGYDYAEIEVVVTDQSGAPVPGTGLTLYTGVRQHAFSQTDASGRHTFRYVPPGAYGVATGPPAGYLAPGTTSYVDTLTILRGARRRVEFEFIRP